MTGTVLITGANSGIGLATTKLFLSNGWKVAGTARRPSEAAELQELHKTYRDSLHTQRLDLQEHDACKTVVEDSIQKLGRIDVLVNNAGFGLFAPLELLSMDVIQSQFETNVFGPMRLIKAILPHFHTAPLSRPPRIINISSGGGWSGFPMASVYTATKGALEIFSESLRFELGAFSTPILVKVVVPDGGVSQTDFMATSGSLMPAMDKFEGMTDVVKSEYKSYISTMLRNFTSMSSTNMEALEVANRIVEAASDEGGRFRYFVGPDQKPSLMLQKRFAGPEKEGESLDEIDDRFIRFTDDVLIGGKLH